MHLISHFCSGVCVGSLLSTFLSRSNTKQSLVIPLVMGVGALLPDIDGITVFFNHRIYYSSLWYSHHGILHTPFGSLLVAVCVFLMTLFARECLKQKNSFKGLLFIFIMLYLGFLLHIAEDMPCPPGPWQGLMLLWPISEQRFGAWTHIWWTNEFLMVIFSCGAFLTWTLSLMTARDRFTQIIQPAVLIFEVNLSVVMLAILFVFISRYQNPLQWEDYQLKVLGELFYSCVNWLNKSIEPIWLREIL